MSLSQKKIYFLSIFFLLGFIVSSQKSFISLYEENDPVDYNIDQTQDLVISKHQAFIQEALVQGDSLNILLGNLYLIYDYLAYAKFNEAAKVIIEVEGFLKTSKNKVWKGRLLRAKGSLQFFLTNYKEAIPYYEQAFEVSAAGKDSNNMAIISEQLGAVYSDLGQTKKAFYYYDLALPLIQKHGDSLNLSVAINNIGTIYAQDSNYLEALKYYRQALQINIEIGNSYKESLARINIADAYVSLQQVDTAVILYTRLIPIIKKKNWATLLSYNYLGFANAYKAKKDWENAFYFQEKYNHLQDSLFGKEVQLKIANLEVQKEEYQRALDKSIYQTNIARNNTQKVFYLIFFLIVLVLLFLRTYYLRVKKNNISIDLANSKDQLSLLTTTLAKKNALLRSKEEKIKELAKEVFQENFTKEENLQHFEEEESLYNLNILTEDDWTTFKKYFEKSHSGYINKLRDSYVDLTSAEERLFLLLKLNLTRNEIADILGISPMSVKKSRTRLRKKLSLTSTDSLEELILSF